MPQVVIDPGHGGHDVRGRSTPYGDRTGATWEKDLNLRLAERVATCLGGDAVLTRAGDHNLPLRDRAAIARSHGARAFVSLHGHADRGGTDIYVHPRAGVDSRSLAESVQRELAWGQGCRCATSTGELAVLHPENLGGTAACLVECGYSEADASDPGAIDRMGAAIARGVRAFLGGRFGRAAARALVAPGSYGIPGPAIVPLQQPPGSNKCWATVYTMLYQWWNRIENQTLDLCATSGAVGPRYASLCANDQVLPWAEIETFAAAAGLVAEPPATYTFDAWVDMLATYGPVWIDYNPGPVPTAGPTHSVILIGIETDGTPAGSTAILIDPAAGRVVTEPWPTFQTRYDNRLQAVGHAWPQVFHWPQRMGGAIRRGFGRAAHAFDVAPGSYGPTSTVTPVTQPSSLTCWAAAYAMMYNYKNGTSLGPRDAVGTIDPAWQANFDANNVLLWVDMERFARAAGLVSEPAANYTLAQWIDWLGRFGPIWINYHPSMSTSGPTHFVVVVGVETDGTDAGSKVFFVDPGTGTLRDVPWLTFAAQFEATVVRTPVPYPQVFHWPAGYRGFSAPGPVR